MTNSTDITINFSSVEVYSLVELFRLLQIFAGNFPEKLPERMTESGVKTLCRELTLKIWGAAQAKYSCPPSMNAVVLKILATDPDFTRSMNH